MPCRKIDFTDRNEHHDAYNASLVDFQIGNEHLCHHGAHFLFETASLVDFQIGNEHLCRHGAHFLLGKRSLVDFQIGNEGEGWNYYYNYYNVHFGQ